MTQWRRQKHPRHGSNMTDRAKNIRQLQHARYPVEVLDKHVHQAERKTSSSALQKARSVQSRMLSSESERLSWTELELVANTPTQFPRSSLAKTLLPACCQVALVCGLFQGFFNRSNRKTQASLQNERVYLFNVGRSGGRQPQGEGGIQGRS